MNKTRMASGAASALAIMALVGCSGGGGGGTTPQNARISVSLMDAPVDGVTAVYVKITSMWIKKEGSPAVELPLTNAPMTVNLMALTDTNAAILVNEAVIEPGSQGAPWFYIALGVPFLLAGLILVVLAPRLARRAV